MIALPESTAAGVRARHDRATRETGRLPIPRWHADPVHCVCDDETHDLVRRDHRDYLKCRACGTETPAPVGARLVDEQQFADACAAWDAEHEPQDERSVGAVLLGVLICVLCFAGAVYGVARLFLP